MKSLFPWLKNSLIGFCLLFVILLFDSCVPEFLKKEVRYSYSDISRAWLPKYPADSIVMISDKQEKEILLVKDVEMDQWKQFNKQKDYRMVSEYTYQFPQVDKTYSVRLWANEFEDELWVSIFSDDGNFLKLAFFSRSGEIDGVSAYNDTMNIGTKTFNHVILLKGYDDEIIRDMYFAKGIGMIQYIDNKGSVWNREF